MVVQGGATFAQSLASQGLIDEYRLVTPFRLLLGAVRRCLKI